jgi:WD40 repeat protein
LLKTIKGHTDSVNTIVISPDEKLLASGSDNGTVKLWSLPNGELLKTLKVSLFFGVNALAISPAGHLLAAGGDNDSIKLWSLPNGELLKTLKDGSYFGVKALAFSPDGKLLVSANSDKIELWLMTKDQEFNTKVKKFKLLRGHQYEIRAIGINASSTLLVTASKDKTIKLWSLTEYLLLKTIKGHTDSVNTIVISPDEKLLASGRWR